MFVRTKTATTELAEKLEARGYAAAAMNGDMAQNHREQTIERLKKGSLDILVATDVAARGLDVDRISHVVNYDIPYDTEAYIHRIGRTGRAGRQGDAILFVAPRERRMLYAIEKATRQKITQLVLPTTETVNNKRIADFKQKISDTLAEGELAFMQGLVEQYRQEHDVPALEIAAALAKMSIGDKPLLLSADDVKPARRRDEARTGKDNDSTPRNSSRRPKSNREPDTDKERYRIEVGHNHGVKPGNIVGAIANESGLDGEHIGQIEIEQDYSLVDLPVGMPKDIFMDLKKVRVCGERLEITRYDPSKPVRPKSGKPKPRGERKDGGKKRANGAGRPEARPEKKRKPTLHLGKSSRAAKTDSGKPRKNKAKNKK
jgi:ATP-dependent RNA helicase DeaD